MMLPKCVESASTSSSTVGKDVVKGGMGSRHAIQG